MENNNLQEHDLRVGIMSDVHIGFTGHLDPYYYGLGQVGSQDKWWEYSLRYFKNRGVDAIVLPGDMTNCCDYERLGRELTISHDEMQRLYQIFQNVFEDTGVQLITIYGNHDGLLQKDETANGGTRDHWQEVFGEPYTATVVKSVKGYTFIGAHWGREAQAGPVLAKAAIEAEGRPVFYIQHPAIKNTTHGSSPERSVHIFEEGLNNVKDWENVIAFSGHEHCPITDERAIWQSVREGEAKCTSVACATMNYGCPDMAPVNGENLFTKHALYMTVKGCEVNFERISFWTEEMVALTEGRRTEQNFSLCTKSAGADWHFVVGGEKPYDFELRYRQAVAPEFPENAEAGIYCADTFAVVRFPAALPLEKDNDLVHSYCVEAVDSEGKVVSTGWVSTEHHVDHTTDYYGPSYQVIVPGLKPDTEYTFYVYAMECYLKKSRFPLKITRRTLMSGDTVLK